MRKNYDNPNGSMSVTGHLRELRNRILVCLLLLLIVFTACLSIAPQLVTFLTDMGKKYSYIYVYIEPQELFLVHINSALVAAVAFCSPAIAFEGYAFCGPGMNQKERITVIGSLVAGAVFFLVGVLFAYFISMPFVLRFLIQFTGEVNVSASISIQQYISFLLTVFIVFGLIFELPVVSVLLTGLGFIRAEWLIKVRKVMIVVIFVIAAIITPPDIASQIMVAIPMLGLYEISILLSRVVGKARKQSEQ